MSLAPAVRIVLRLGLGLGLCVSGCSNLLHSNTPPEQIYYLRPPVAAAGATAAAAGANSSAVLPATGASLRVGRPIAAPGLDTPHIMLVQADHRMNFFSGSRWPGTAPDVLEALAVERLRASGAWASIEDSSSPFPSDYLLQMTVRRFEADYTEGAPAPVVHVVLECTLGRREGRDVIATFTASASAPAAENRLSEVVAAFERATGAALNALSQQAAQAVHGDSSHAAQNEASPAPSSRR